MEGEIDSGVSCESGGAACGRPADFPDEQFYLPIDLQVCSFVNTYTRIPGLKNTAYLNIVYLKTPSGSRSKLQLKCVNGLLYKKSEGERFAHKLRWACLQSLKYP